MSIASQPMRLRPLLTVGCARAGADTVAPRGNGPQGRQSDKKGKSRTPSTP